MCMRSAIVWSVTVVIGALVPHLIHADELDYARDIKPLLAAHCAKCHGPEKQENGLRVDAGSLAVRGGDSGAAIVPGKPAASLLIQAVKGEGDASKMPPEDEPQLSSDQISLLVKWIEAGAQFP